ncbi:MAG: UdgX family uracil-DNA binding protein [Burkholderiales bacterium]
MPTSPTHDDITACRRCPLWANATQGVAGAGARRARIMLVGEQPGDEEDRQGLPFVGPAGQLLRRALGDAGLDADDVFVTNAVKHFKWEPRGKRRLHKTPAQKEIAACHAWLDEELAAVRPAVIVALGATALGALTGRKMTIADARAAQLVHDSGARLVATYHPSAALRAPDKARREELYDIIVADLVRARKLAAG